MRKYFALFGIGALAASLATLAGYAIEAAGMGQTLEQTLSLRFSWSLLYSRCFWGGVWGLLYALPGLWRLNWIQAAVIVAVPPALVNLLVLSPRAGHGMFGLSRGVAYPLFVALGFLAWGGVTTYLASRTRAVA